jgi:hypothetical protein
MNRFELKATGAPSKREVSQLCVRKLGVDRAHRSKRDWKIFSEIQRPIDMHTIWVITKRELESFFDSF